MPAWLDKLLQPHSALTGGEAAREAGRFTRNLEVARRSMWRTWCAKQ